MRAVVVDHPGDESVLRIADVPPPPLGPGELRIRVVATALNRADLLQRRGLYPPPAGASPLLGLECAGEVLEVGSGVTGWHPGERAMALLAGGGYAEEAVVAAGCAMPVPEAISLHEAAAVPEAFLTVLLTVFTLARFPDGGTALVHGGGSGVGTAAIQMIRAVGGSVVVTAGSESKCSRCLELGAHRAVDYRHGDFVADTLALTGGRGADVVLDSIGAPYLARNLACLAVGGRQVLIATMGGGTAEIDLRELMRRRASLIGSTLRGRSVEEKTSIVEAFGRRFLPLLAARRIRPIIDRVLPLEGVAEAHRAMQASEHFGKIVLAVQDALPT